MARTKKHPGERLVAKTRFRLKVDGEVVALRAGDPVPALPEKERDGLILSRLANWEPEPEPELKEDLPRDEPGRFAPEESDDEEVEVDA